MTDTRQRRAITREALPRGYAEASASSGRSRTAYLRAVVADRLLLVGGAGFASASPASLRVHQLTNFLSAACFACGLVLTRITSKKERDREWIRARTRAEDIKANAWRFMTAAPPYPAAMRDEE